MKFCLLTMAGRGQREPAASFAFFLHDPAAIDAATFALTPDEITLLNPNTGTCPIFRTRRDAEITLGIYRRVPVLINEAKVAAGDPDGNPWGVSFMTMFHMSNDSHLFRTREQLESDGWTLTGNVFDRPCGAGSERMLPLYEGKMCGPYDHRIADVRSQPNRGRTAEPTAVSRQHREVESQPTRPTRLLGRRKPLVDQALMSRATPLPAWIPDIAEPDERTDGRRRTCAARARWDIRASPRDPTGHSAGRLLQRPSTPSHSTLSPGRRSEARPVNFFYVYQFPVLRHATFDSSAPGKGRDL